MKKVVLVTKGYYLRPYKANLLMPYCLPYQTFKHVQSIPLDEGWALEPARFPAHFQGVKDRQGSIGTRDEDGSSASNRKQLRQQGAHNKHEQHTYVCVQVSYSTCSGYGDKNTPLCHYN